MNLDKLFFNYLYKYYFFKNNNKIKMFNNNHKKNQNTHVKNIYIFYFK